MKHQSGRRRAVADLAPALAATAILLAAQEPLGAQDPELRHQLDELAAREDAKPYDRLERDGVHATERTVFRDTVTGATLMRVTHDPGTDRHDYYDIPVWSVDGSMMLIQHGSGIGDRHWLAAADHAWLHPLEDGLDDLEAGGATYWAWEAPQIVYTLDRGVLYKVDVETGVATELYDLKNETGITTFGLAPPHPKDDMLLFDTGVVGHIYWMDPHADPLEVVWVPTDDRWAVEDGIHRLRWTKDTGYHLFVGQNYIQAAGEPLEESWQWVLDRDGTMLDCMQEGYDKRAGHPDWTLQGELLTGFYTSELLPKDCFSGDPPRLIYEGGSNHHSSNSWDGRWHVLSVGPDANLDIRGLTTSNAIVVLSMDGRAQSVFAYHYASYADDLSASVLPITSPDGTKIAYSSDMMERGVHNGEATGNADVYTAVLRPPAPPAGVSAVTTGVAVEISWSRPLHAESELYWNPGNLSREIAGYHVWRGETSGGPYHQISDLVEDTVFVDDTVIPGVDYFYVVQSVEPSGLGSLFSAEVHGNLLEDQWPGRIHHYYEAEQAEVVLPMVLVPDGWGASGGWHAATFASEPDPSHPLEPFPAVVNFSVESPKSRNFRLWARVRGEDGATGTFDVAVDGVPTDSVTVSPGEWEWVSLGVDVFLEQGPHQVSFSTSDVLLCLDLIAISDDADFVPADRGSADTVAPSPPTGSAVVRIDDSTKKILWQPSPDPDVVHYNLYCGRDGSYPLDNRRILLSPAVTEAFDWGIPDGWETVYKITAVDRFGNESTALVHDPAVNGELAAPEAFDDAWIVDEDEILSVGGAGVLANDLDADGDPLTAVLLTPPASGELELAAEGGFVYTPDAHFNGTDSFTYKADDGLARSAEATVTLTINAVNDPPDTLADFYETDEDSGLAVTAPLNGVLGNDTDVEGEVLTASLVTAATHGDVTLYEDGTFHYAPDDNYHGTDTFTYQADDGTDLSPATTVTVTVHPVDDAPVAIKDEYAGTEDLILAVAAPGVLENDLEFDGEVLVPELTQPASNGVVTLGTDGSFTYVPSLDFEGTDEFFYVASDGITDSNEVKVTLTIANVNDPPVAADDAYSTPEDVNLSVNGGISILDNDVDPDVGNLDAEVVDLPLHGILNLNGDHGTFTYVPDDDFNGVDSFTYRALDGVTESNVATVTITVEPVDDPTVAVRDTYFGTEDSPLVVAAPGIFENDLEVDGDVLEPLLDSAPASGILDLLSDGSFTYTPDPDFQGTVEFFYSADDGTSISNSVKVSLVIENINDPPVAADDAYSTQEDVDLSINPQSVLDNDSDVDPGTLDAVLVDEPANGVLTWNEGNGIFTYRPDADFNGVDILTYRASDGIALSEPATVTITVEPVDDAPTATEDAYSGVEDQILTVAAPGVLENDLEVDGESLTAELVEPPSSGEVLLHPDGGFDYTPEADFTGSASFRYAAGDESGNLSNTVRVTLTISDDLSDPPLALDDAYSVNEDGVLSRQASGGLLKNDSDPEGDPITAVLDQDPDNGVAEVDTDGAFTYTPEADFEGTDTFTYRARDDGGNLSEPALVTVTVNPRNDRPTATADEYAVDEDQVLSVAAPGVLANDDDVDGDVLEAVLEAGPSHGDLSLGPDGGFTYTPEPDFQGLDSFTYRASDGTLTSGVTQVQITVSGVNDLPVALDDLYVTDEDAKLQLTPGTGVLANDEDVDGDPLTSALVSGAAHGTLTLKDSGSFVYDPDPDFNGTDTFTYVANDGTGDSAPATVTLVVDPVNDPPQAAIDEYTIDEDTTLTLAVPGVLANDTDADGDPLTAGLLTLPASGVVTLEPDGSLVYTPEVDFAGNDSFTYQAVDPDSASDDAVVRIVVSPVNDPPVGAADEYSTPAGVTLTVFADTGVLVNDTDPDGDSLSAALVAGPANGVLVSLATSGRFTYEPDPGFSGTDTFTYEVSDGEAVTGPVLVTIQVL